MFHCLLGKTSICSCFKCSLWPTREGIDSSVLENEIGTITCYFLIQIFFSLCLCTTKSTSWEELIQGMGVICPI